MPPDVAAAGGRFVAADRAAPTVGAGADLLVDCLCFTAAQARSLLPLLGDVGSTEMISTKAVYVDGDGHHVNSAVAPAFDGPVRESQATVAPREDVEYRSAEGYGANKVAGARILNAADPDAPSALEISRTVTAHLDHEWREVLLDGHAPDGLGRHTWDRVPPIRLDTTAARELGYEPAGDHAATVTTELDWLVATADRLPEGFDHDYFAPMLDYAAEDAHLGT